ncbi:MAG: GHKL domain-containing protein [Parachlamydiaceae bacterium]|nr:GHKL domain-containing protein [Parachlamydiaceae bacterium]
MKLSPLSSAQVCTKAKGTFFIRLDGSVGIFDPVAEELLNFPAEEVLSHTFWDFFVDDFFGFSMHQTLLEKQVPPFTSISESPSAVAYPTLDFDITFLSVEVDSNTTMNGILIIIRNIETLQRHNAIAVRNTRMKELEKMAGLVAHEIRNPLGGIKGFSALLQRDLQGNPESYKLATYIVEGADNLNRLLDKILSITRSLQLPLESHDLVPLLQELLNDLNADESIDPHIDISFEAFEERIVVLIEPENLKTALLQLISNGIRAMPQGGELAIKVKSSGTEVIIEISDTGCGILKENQAKIFSPFYTTQGKGHGFGLAEVHKIIHAHHGEIDFVSEENVGTTFMVYLPVVG